MASLHEYFVKGAGNNLTTSQKWAFSDLSGNNIGEVTARLHLDFEANAKFISFYVPNMDVVELPEAFVLNKVEEILNWPNTQVDLKVKFGGEDKDAKDLRFSGQIYIYSERPVADTHRHQLLYEANKIGHILTFRSVAYVDDRNRWEKPRAFISHDSRDKAAIAELLAVELQKSLCPVWYDEFSLKIGDSLRESIEQGLKECRKCILVLTPNFLANSGWTKREYDSIFTRELVEKQRVILPIWHDVSANDIYQFSPVLADRVAVQWSLGIEEVARRLIHAIDG